MMIEHTVAEEPPDIISKPASLTRSQLTWFTQHPFSARPRLLIVEENEEMRDHFAQFLGDEFATCIAPSSEEAMMMAHIAPIDIVLLDIEHGNEMQAVKLSRLLRKSIYCSNADFISITGYMLPEGKSVLKRADFDYRISKPFTLRRLRELLRHCVAKEAVSILNGLNINLALPVSTPVHPVSPDLRKLV